MFLLSCKQGQRVDHKNLIIFKATTFFKVVALFFRFFLCCFLWLLLILQIETIFLIKIYL